MKLDNPIYKENKFTLLICYWIKGKSVTSLNSNPSQSTETKLKKSQGNPVTFSETCLQFN